MTQTPATSTIQSVEPDVEPDGASGRIDCGIVWKIALRAPPMGDPGSVRPVTVLTMLDSLLENVSVNRPVVLGKTLAEVARTDPGCARLIVEGGLAHQIRAEIDERRTGSQRQAAPLVTRLKTAESPSNV